jgi:DNA polymerase/3'-5' exonuclease PolX
MKLQHAREIAKQVRNQLSPHCSRCEIAGSIRRQKPEVHDIEIVCIPNVVPYGLFLDEYMTAPGFIDAVDRYPCLRGNPSQRYTQRRHPAGINLDLFMATPANWGMIYAIRTGPAVFSHRHLAARWCKLGYKSIGGILVHHTGRRQYIQEERQLFDILGMPWIDPQDREAAIF